MKRFDDKWVRNEETGCHQWTSTKGANGYGHFWLDGETVSAHRVAWELHNGPIPDLAVIRHKCDNPMCVNPDHLEIGTNVDNVADRHERNRDARGSRQGLAKLTDAKARRIFADTRTQDVIAAEYGVHQSQVSNIKRRRTWAHATEGMS